MAWSMTVEDSWYASRDLVVTGRVVGEPGPGRGTLTVAGASGAVTYDVRIVGVDRALNLAAEGPKYHPDYVLVRISNHQGFVPDGSVVAGA